MARQTHHDHTVKEVFVNEDTGKRIETDVRVRTIEETERLQALVRTLSYSDPK